MANEAPIFRAFLVLFWGLLLVSTSACMKTEDSIGVSGMIPFEGNLEIRR